MIYPNDEMLICNFPREFNIEITAICNLRCPVCPRTQNMSRKTGHMDFKLFSRIIDEIAKYDSLENPIVIGLHLFGEALLHPEFIRFVNYAASKLVQRPDVSCNGVFLSPDLTDSILKSGLGSIGIWIDSISEDVYNILRAGGSFQKVQSNVIYLLIRKKESNLFYPKVYIGMLQSKLNKEMKNEFIKFWSNQMNGVLNTQLLILPMHNWAGQVSNHYVIKHILPKFHLFSPCSRPYSQFNIYWDGDVTPCCYDANKYMLIGNMSKNNIAEIWHGKLVTNIRQDMLTGRLDDLKLCKNCHWIRRYRVRQKKPMW